jgi:hypothetical protein
MIEARESNSIYLMLLRTIRILLDEYFSFFIKILPSSILMMAGSLDSINLFKLFVFKFSIILFSSENMLEHIINITSSRKEHVSFILLKIKMQWEIRKISYLFQFIFFMHLSPPAYTKTQPYLQIMKKKK